LMNESVVAIKEVMNVLDTMNSATA
jgi:hypothetical protein